MSHIYVCVLYANQNNILFFKICFSFSLIDLPSKTATGTIAIQVEDFNDHCPTLASKVKTLCTEKDAVLVTAVDEDAPPNGSPFTFNVVPEGTKGKWTVEYFNGMCVCWEHNGPHGQP